MAASRKGECWRVAGIRRGAAQIGFASAPLDRLFGWGFREIRHKLLRVPRLRRNDQRRGLVVSAARSEPREESLGLCARTAHAAD